MHPLIVALATPLGHSAIAVVRLSGAGLPEALRRVCGRTPTTRRASLVAVRDAEGRFDEALLTLFSGPNSYTGEDVAEVSCHGNPLIVERLLGAFIAVGARMASPGEFTRRALLNGRLDTIGAEAVLASLHATSPEGLLVARSSGKLRAAVDGLKDRLLNVAAELEAILDYPAEDLLFSSDAQLVWNLDQVAQEARSIAAGWRAGAVALQGARVVLVGRVNAGKSSLFNALLGETRAIVSPVAGTTRDVVESVLVLPGGRVVLMDTAGDRPSAGGDDGPVRPDDIERAGIVLGSEAAAGADLRIVCVAATDAEPAERVPASRPGTLLVATKLDRGTPGFAHDYAVSSVTGEGIDALRGAILPAITGQVDAGCIVSSARQRDVLLAIADAASNAARALPPAGPAVAVTELMAAIRHADALTGQDSDEEVLNRLFARFCVGK
ncbi:MAG: tRNA modification GTPase [Myxococcales bacterium]|nr:tRNA modification GTPase [Myxococcales bacterium]